MMQGLKSAISIVQEKRHMEPPSPKADVDIQKIEDVADPNKVRVPDISEYKGLALSLAHAFAVDDVAMYFIDTPDRPHWTAEQKWDLHLSIMEYIVYAHFLDGLVTTVGEGYGAVALWMPPGKNMDSLWTQLRSGMWRLNYKLSAEGRERFFTEFLPMLHDTKHAVLGHRDDDSWYLVYLDTRPEGRGKGYARKLMEHVSQQADRDGRPCYLESSSAINVKIYEKMGYDVREKLLLTRGDNDLQLDIMVREPKN